MYSNIKEKIESRKKGIKYLLDSKFNEESNYHSECEDMTMFFIIKSYIFTDECNALKATYVSPSNPKDYKKLIEKDDSMLKDSISKKCHKPEHRFVSEKELHNPLLIYLLNEAIPNVCKQYNLGNKIEKELVKEVFEGIKKINKIVPNKTYEIDLNKLKNEINYFEYIDSEIIISDETLYSSANKDFDSFINNKKNNKSKKGKKNKTSYCTIV